MARDNFPEGVIRRLRDRVAHRCSNPSCRVATSAPHDGDAVTNIGKAAHISAASPGGPRYDPTMTTEQRKSFANGIWLCANHADSIDRDVTGHPVELLIQWKREAEATAKSELGHRQPKATDAPDMLTQALTGLPKTFLASSIQNAHAATAGALEKLDPRFKVTSSFDPQRGTQFSISAKENVGISFRMEPDAVGSIALQYSRLLDHGVGFEVDAKNFRLEGSPLLSSISEMGSRDTGRLLFGTEPIQSVCKLSIIAPSGDRFDPLDDIHGDLIVGQKSSTFSGVTMGGLLSISFTLSRLGAPQMQNLNLKFNLQEWEEKPVTRLRWFSKFHAFVKAVQDEKSFSVSLEIEGERLLYAAMTLDRRGIEPLADLLHYIELAREISGYLDADILYPVSPEISTEQFVMLEKAVATFRGYSYGSDVVISPARVSVTLTEEDGAAEFDQPSKNVGFISLHQPFDGQLKVFGYPISLPEVSITFRNVRMDRVARVGDKFEFELYPLTGFAMEFHFVTNKQKRGA